jgi:hypothetical protein
MNRHKIALNIYFLASIADDPDGGKSFPVVLVVAPVVSLRLLFPWSSF